MSAKTGKRTRKLTADEADPDFKMPGSSKAKEESAKSAKDEPDTNLSETNGLKAGGSKVETANGENGDDPSETSKRVIQTRSRSSTPLIKTPDGSKSSDLDDTNGSKNDEIIDLVDDANESINGKNEETNGIESVDTNDDINVSKDSESVETNDDVSVAKDSSKAEKENNVQNGKNDEEPAAPTPTDSNVVEVIEPVVVEKDEDEIAELQFDDNDVDVESEGSPNRCKTRRSQTRNVSTPKTPKLVEPETETKAIYVTLNRLPNDGVSGRSTPKKITSSTDSNIGSSESQSQPDENVDFDNSDTYSSVSTDNISTRAVAGSDATRNIDFTYQDSALFEDNSFTNPNPNHTLADTLRNLSPRRTIRPITSDYRRMALQNNLDVKNDSYPDYESVERISVSAKRKNRSFTPEQSKRFKKETSGGLMSYLSSFKGTTHRSSTPKLIGYENKKGEFEEDEPSKIKFEIDDEGGREKKWCSIM